MQGGIGDYIHYRNYRYRYYGIGVREKGKISDSKALSDQKKTLKINSGSTMLSSTILEDIRATTESIMYPNQKGSNCTKIIDNVEQERIRKEVENFVKQWGEHIEIDWSRGGKPSGTSKDGSIQTLGSKKKEDDKEYRVYVKTVSKRVKQLRNAITRQKLKGLLTDEQVSELRKAINDISTEMNAAGLKLSPESSQIIRSSNAQHWGFIDRLNALFKSLSYPKKKILGEMLEIVQRRTLEAVLNFANKTGEDIVYKCLSTKGSNKANVIVENNLGTFVNQSIFLNKNESVKLSENTSLTSNLSLGDKTVKADVTISMTDAKGNTDFAGFSNKNYFSSSLHIVEETPLLDLLMDQNSAFVTHYLNMITRNETGGGTDSTINPNYIHEIKRILAVKALQGAVPDLQSYSAGYLILNDREKKKVVLKSMKEIIDNIEKKSSIENNFTFSPKVESIVLPNMFVRATSGNPMLGARARIANVLVEARKVKIKASMKKSALYL